MGGAANIDDKGLPTGNESIVMAGHVQLQVVQHNQTTEKVKSDSAQNSGADVMECDQQFQVLGLRHGTWGISINWHFAVQCSFVVM